MIRPGGKWYCEAITVDRDVAEKRKKIQFLRSFLNHLLPFRPCEY